jgi:D-alanyl-D-alanine carboxypeptidase
MPTPFAQGFTLQGDFAKPDAPSNATHWNPSWAWTAGDLISDIDDLLVYARALGTGHGLLGAAAQTERLTFPAAGGYGIGAGCSEGGWFGHTGELPGYNTTLYYNTAADIAVVVQTNSDIASGNCEERPTLTDNHREQECSSPAKRVFVAISKALGRPFSGP